MKTTLPVTSPVSGEAIAQVQLGGAAEVDAPVVAAKNAFPAWSGLTQKVAVRLELMRVVRLPFHCRVSRHSAQPFRVLARA